MKSDMMTNDTKEKADCSGDMISKFDTASPTVYRYNVPELMPYFSENSFVAYKSRVEAALARTWASRGIISENVADKIEAASKMVTAEEVYEEEEKNTHHDIIAQMNMIKKHLHEVCATEEEYSEASRAVHRAATSYDIVDTANSARCRDAFYKVIIPDMIALEKSFIALAEKEKETRQIGRTHQQHAEPITFGFATAWFVDRFGGRLLKVKDAVDNLEGKFSGAVGTYSALSLFVDDPEEFEKEVLAHFNLRPARISTQIIPPESMADLVHYAITSFGVVANWAWDIYNSERPEVAEIGQPRGSPDISASSTMANKANPQGAENIISLFKKLMAPIITTYLDLISLYQRDLTNSASSRFVPEEFVIFDYGIRRMTRIIGSLTVNYHNLQRNLDASSKYSITEPLQLLLGDAGLMESHKKMGALADKAVEEGLGRSVLDLANEDPEVSEYIGMLRSDQLDVLSDPSTNYIGKAVPKADEVIDYWAPIMQTLSDELAAHSQ
jgi:adenylosuccinate lyase